MASSFRPKWFSAWGRPTLAGLALVVLLTGCGGGGGGGGGGTTPSPMTVTITGTLQDQTTTNVLPNRTVTVVSTNLTGISNAAGQFSIANVPVTTITLSVTDSNGASDGNSAAINLSTLNGDPRSVGVIVLNVTGSGPPAPPPAVTTGHS